MGPAFGSSMLNRFHSSRQAPTITETPSAEPPLTASRGITGITVPSITGWVALSVLMPEEGSEVFIVSSI